MPFSSEILLISAYLSFARCNFHKKLEIWYQNFSNYLLKELDTERDEANSHLPLVSV